MTGRSINSRTDLVIFLAADSTGWSVRVQSVRKGTLPSAPACSRIRTTLDFVDIESDRTRIVGLAGARNLVELLTEVAAILGTEREELIPLNEDLFLWVQDWVVWAADFEHWEWAFELRYSPVVGWSAAIAPPERGSDFLELTPKRVGNWDALGGFLAGVRATAALPRWGVPNWLSVQLSVIESVARSVRDPQDWILDGVRLASLTGSTPIDALIPAFAVPQSWTSSQEVVAVFGSGYLPIYYDRAESEDFAAIIGARVAEDLDTYRMLDLSWQVPYPGCFVGTLVEQLRFKKDAFLAAFGSPPIPGERAEWTSVSGSSQPSHRSVSHRRMRARIGTHDRMRAQFINVGPSGWRRAEVRSNDLGWRSVVDPWCATQIEAAVQSNTAALRQWGSGFVELTLGEWDPPLRIVGDRFAEKLMPPTWGGGPTVSKDSRPEAGMTSG